MTENYDMLTPVRECHLLAVILAKLDKLSGIFKTKSERLSLNRSYGQAGLSRIPATDDLRFVVMEKRF